MTRVGWLVDHASHVGGAELTQAEFRAAAPDGVSIVDCRPGDIRDADLYVIQNCVTYSREDLAQISKPATKFWHDVGPHLQPGVRDWLDSYAKAICCSPAQADYMGLLGDAVFIPPPIDLSRFAAAAESVNGDRRGAVCVASWRNFGKAAYKAAEWGARNGGVEFYGGGVCAPPGSVEVPYDEMPALLASFRTFVFLPTVIEPFGRLVAEAWSAGCEVVTNGLVGARYWIEENPEAIETAAEDFWREVLR